MNFEGLREAENRKLAEWLEPTPTWRDDDVTLSEGGAWLRSASRALRHLRDKTEPYPRDFRTDEAANAMLLEKMRRPLLVSDWPGCEGWRVDIGVERPYSKPIGPTCANRRDAIVQAALKFIDSREGEK